MYKRDLVEGKWRKLRGEEIPDKYQRGACTGEFQDANFGKSVNINGNLIPTAFPLCFITSACPEGTGACPAAGETKHMGVRVKVSTQSLFVGLHPMFRTNPPF